jgi:hypothetical protein
VVAEAGSNSDGGELERRGQMVKGEEVGAAGHVGITKAEGGDSEAVV